jgi:hypothetical protein
MARVPYVTITIFLELSTTICQLIRQSFTLGMQPMAVARVIFCCTLIRKNNNYPEKFLI